MRVYFGVCGIGLGHVGRSAIIAKKISEMGNEVLFSTYLDAIKFVKKEGFPLARAPALQYIIKADGTVDFRKSSAYPGVLSLFIFLNQIVAEMRFMKAFQPDVVLSDSRGSSLIAAKTLGIPEVTMLNQYKVTIPRTKRFLKLARIGDAYLLGLVGGLWAIGKKVIIPDFPPPFTISTENLRIPPIMEKKVTFIGPIIETKPEDLPSKETLKEKLGFDDRPLIFAPISGSAMEKAHFITILKDILSKFPDDYQISMSLGDPNSSLKPATFGGLTVYPWLTNRFEFLKACDLVISRAGHGTITQSVCYGKPMILIPTPNHTEQENNAKRTEELGVAKTINQKDLTYKKLLKCVSKILTSNKYYKTSLHLQENVSEYNGIESAIEIITEVAEN